MWGSEDGRGLHAKECGWQLGAESVPADSQQGISPITTKT